MSSHIRHFLIGDDTGRDYWAASHPAATVIPVPLDRPAAVAAGAPVNPWDQVVFLPGFYRLPIPDRAVVWDTVAAARAAGRRLTPAERGRCRGSR